MILSFTRGRKTLSREVTPETIGAAQALDIVGDIFSLIKDVPADTRQIVVRWETKKEPGEVKVRPHYTLETLDCAIYLVCPKLKADTRGARVEHLKIAAEECFMYPEKWHGLTSFIIRQACIDLATMGQFAPKDEDS